MSRREFTSQKALQDHAEQTGQVCVLEGIALRQPRDIAHVAISHTHGDACEPMVVRTQDLLICRSCSRPSSSS